jgi:hypothetical protein
MEAVADVSLEWAEETGTCLEKINANQGKAITKMKPCLEEMEVVTKGAPVTGRGISEPTEKVGQGRRCTRNR